MFKKTIVPLKSLRSVWKSLFTLLMIILVFHFAVAAKGWRNLAPGIEYQDVGKGYITPWSHIHAFKVNLKDNHLSLVLARDLGKKYASVDEYAQFSKALLAINGGFFDDQFQPLGLRIKNKKQINALKPISWWGIFYIQNGQARLSNVARFHKNNQIDFAVQSGPRLLINGYIPPLKAGRDERTALGITPDGQIIILVTEYAALSTTELAQMMKAPPLNCINALNLDGGNSTQLYAKLDHFSANVHGFSKVSDAIIVKANPQSAQ